MVSLGMSKMVDISGQTFGKLMAIKPTDRKSHLGKVWECQCVCGELAYYPAAQLRSGTTKSCGCTKRLDVIGKRFGELTVIKKSYNGPNGRAFYEVACDCGKTSIVAGSKLVNGHTQTCGNHYRKDQDFSSLGKPNGKAVLNRVYSQYQDGARRRGLLFDLTPEFAKELFVSNCAYCDSPPSREVRQARRKYVVPFLVNGIDRKDNAKGYTHDNVVSSCKFCNIMKLTMTTGEFMDRVKLIYKNCFLP